MRLRVMEQLHQVWYVPIVIFMNGSCWMVGNTDMNIPSNSPSWLRTAWMYIGVKEWAGPRHNNVILKWLDQLGAWWRDDETPWCGVFVAIVFKNHRIAIPKLYMRAKAWLDWGCSVQVPFLGCIAIIERKGGGHVFFVVGETPEGDLIGLGGNQGNMVTLATFPRSRVIGYRMPSGWDVLLASRLPVVMNYVVGSPGEA